MKAPLDPEFLDFARRLRKDQTDAEKLLWSVFRSRQLLGLKFRRQHSIGPYILDFYCATVRLAIELDGGQHTEPSSLEYDSKRTQTLNDHGIRVLRFWDPDVLTSPDEVREEIYRALLAAQKEPSPPPSPLGTKERD